MNFRTAGALATLLLGLAGPGDQATAQYYPPAQAYPPQTYPPQRSYPPYRPAPGLEEDDDAPFYDPPMVQRRPLPPPGVAGPQVADPPPGASVRAGRGTPVYPEEVELPPPPPGYFYREGPQGYELSAEPNARLARPNYATPPGMLPGVSPGLPPSAGAQPGLPGGPEQDGVRPPMSIGPGQVDPGPAGAVRGDARMAALPPDVRPETGPVKELPLQFRRTQVDYRTKEPAGTLIVDTQNTYLYLVVGNGKAMRYGIGVGREGFTWAGAEKVSRMAEWPDWHPPEEMIDRQPYLPRFMAGGPGNPLGARALYLGQTVYRIHGTNQPSTIGTFVSSGCIRLTNEDVMDLYSRVKVGTRVVVLPGKAPATAAATPIGPPTAATPIGPPAAVKPGVPPVTMAPLGPPPSAMAR
jgi:lipoprotein-anchoring transpeptidase ErfK/SrfK